ncbi:hypothetical protein FJY90_07845, partial [Candidatus Gottesmanbacteria bacterium]|nr:hypothetical protein [Candidatus Gottesmanbacteria bacterium]
MKLNKVHLLILSIFILSGIGVVVWQSKNKVNQMKSKAEEIKTTAQKNAPVSDWIPLPITEYQKQLTTLITAAEKEKTENKSLQNKLIGKSESENKDKRLQQRYDLLDESISILSGAINKDDYQNYIDTNHDNLISYQEFNSKTATISQAVYNLSHSKNLDYDDGVYNRNWKRIESTSLSKTVSSQTTNQIQIWVEGGIYNQILPKLLQYKSNIEACENYEMDFYL